MKNWFYVPSSLKWVTNVNLLHMYCQIGYNKGRNTNSNSRIWVWFPASSRCLPSTGKTLASGSQDWGEAREPHIPGQTERNAFDQR